MAHFAATHSGDILLSNYCKIRVNIVMKRYDCPHRGEPGRSARGHDNAASSTTDAGDGGSGGGVRHEVSSQNV